MALSAAPFQTDVTGKKPEKFADVTDLECIFTPVHEIRQMEKLVNLRSVCSAWLCGGVVVLSPIFVTACVAAVVSLSQ